MREKSSLQREVPGGIAADVADVDVGDGSELADWRVAPPGGLPRAPAGSGTVSARIGTELRHPLVSRRDVGR